MTAAVVTTGRAPLAGIRRFAKPQLVVAAGQVAAGVGNLAFALVAARLLAPRAYADLVAFLSLYLLLHLPAASLSAAGALGSSAGVRRRLALAGGAITAVLLAAHAPLASVLGMPRPAVALLAAAAPGALLLGFERGRLYGARRHRAVVATLVAEPVSRFALGGLLVAGAGAGATGGAAAVVAGGYAALVAARLGTRRCPALDVSVRRPGVSAAVIVFFAVAVLQTQDLLIAKAVLDESAAATFAAVSALGSAVAFATATIPLVLLPDAATRRPGARRAAVLLAAQLGAAMVLVALVAPRLVVDGLFGEEYRDAATLLAPYAAAMALLGIGRVLLAAASTARHARWAARFAVAVAAGHAAALVLLADDAATVTGTTFAAMAILVGGAAAPVVQLPVRRAIAARWTRPVAVVAALGVAALVIRLIVLRGIWIDEAISVQQARLPWGAMLDQLRSVDVHPPGFQALLWGAVRVVGTGTIAVKLVSILAGVALVPALYATGAALWDRRAGSTAAALGVAAPLLVWYSQEARMYSVFMLLGVLALHGQVQAVRRGRVADWALYAVATAAMLWTQYFAVFPIVVQQLGFVAALWLRRHDRDERRRLLVGWSLASLVAAALLAPLVPFASDQLDAYRTRRAGPVRDVPSQAGTDVSGVGGDLSVYAVIANGIWAVLGYHADRAMAQIGALWPIGMLAALVALGRRWCRSTSLLVALVVLPALALFALGLVKRDLFEVRYFAGAVPILLLLIGRAISVPERSRVGVAVLGTVALATSGVALVDQQLNGANPRRYDFGSALGAVRDAADEDDVLLYEPSYLAAVVDYYAPELRARPLGAGELPDDAGDVFVLATDRVINSEASSARVGDVLATLQQERSLVGDIRRSNVRVWVLR